MKSLSTIFLVLLFTINASAQKKTEDRRIHNFNSIAVGISADVYITKGSTHKVILEGDEEDLQEIETEVSGNRLKIGFEDNNRWWGNNKRKSKIIIHITMPELTGVSLSGSGNVKSDDLFVSEKFHGAVSGSGGMELNINTSEADLDISGSGRIILKGKGEEADISISGSGDIDAEDFKVRTADIKIMGSGNCTIHVSEELESKIMGSGNIRYSGDPKHINNNSMGSGSIKKI